MNKSFTVTATPLRVLFIALILLALGSVIGKSLPRASAPVTPTPDNGFILSDGTGSVTASLAPWQILVSDEYGFSWSNWAGKPSGDTYLTLEEALQAMARAKKWSDDYDAKRRESTWSVVTPAKR